MRQPSRFDKETDNEVTATFDLIDANTLPNERIRYVLIATRYKGKWLFCRHASRQSWELPGGKREHGESPFQAAKRELHEETGAKEFSLTPVTAYSIIKSDIRYGILYMADVTALSGSLHHEIAEIRLFDGLPEELRFPDIQPGLFDFAHNFVCRNNLLP